MRKWMLTTAAAVSAATLLAGNAQAAAAEQTHKFENKDTFWAISLKYKAPLKKRMDVNSALEADHMQIKSEDVMANNEAQSAKAKESMHAESVAPPAALTVTAPGGTTHTYKKELAVRATAYTAAASENGKWGAVDYFGNKLKVGTVAVGPNMIPLGTKLYVTGYDFNGLPKGGMLAAATDMGGAIKGNRIDIFVPGTTQEARKFGFQDVKVYILQ